MTTDHIATRTLVKSPPELWAECSEAESLARHIGEFGEITITRLHPESSIDWEGEHASGTVVIEPSGWGTKVTLTVQTNVEPEEEEEVDETLEETVAEPEAVVEDDPAPVRGRWRRLIDRWRSRAEEPEPGFAPEPVLEELVDEPAPDPEAPAPAPEPPVEEDRLDPEAILSAALDSLGQAHHRPFSRA